MAAVNRTLCKQTRSFLIAAVTGKKAKNIVQVAGSSRTRARINPALARLSRVDSSVSSLGFRTRNQVALVWRTTESLVLESTSAFPQNLVA
jgi:hypothetical protein